MGGVAVGVVRAGVGVGVVSAVVVLLVEDINSLWFTSWKMKTIIGNVVIESFVFLAFSSIWVVVNCMDDRTVVSVARLNIDCLSSDEESGGKGGLHGQNCFYDCPQSCLLSHEAEISNGTSNDTLGFVQCKNGL